MAMTAVSGRWRSNPTAGTAATAHPAVARCSLHPWSYLHHHGPTSWPVIRHRCDIRPCVNPAHLEAGTQAANISDTVSRGGWTTIARHGPASWPTLAYRLRTTARASDRDLVRQLTARPPSTRPRPPRRRHLLARPTVAPVNQ